VGIFDPREFIAAESQRIPFKAALSKPSLWQDAFKNWPLPPIADWKNWYKRVLADNSAKTQTWDSLCIAQCLELSLAETPKNEVLTPKFGKVRSQICGSNSVRNPSGGRKVSSDEFGRRVHGRQFASVRQGNCCADFAGLRGDVARAEGENGWISNRT
jgi:hypothetical protein